MKIEKSTCEIASAALGTLFLCCVRVVYQNTRALLLVFCYSYETRHVLVTHLATCTLHSVAFICIAASEIDACCMVPSSDITKLILTLILTKNSHIQ